MKDKIIAMLLVVSMILSLLTGCSNANPVIDPTGISENTATNETEPSVTTSSSESTTATFETEATEESTEAPAETVTEPTDAPTEPTETTPPETVPPTTQPPETEPLEEETPETPQRKAVNMLNYITVLTQEINASKGSRVYLDSVKSSLKNNLALSAIDSETQKQINNLWKTIDEYSMVSIKRERIEFMYDQNKAQAMREAIPNPLGMLSTVQSGNALKAAASVLYMAIDAKASYERASTEADLKYIQDGWELDDAEAKELSASQLNLLNYMINMSRNNGFPDDWALKPDDVEAFVEWTSKDDPSDLISKIKWLEKNEKVYREFRTYWLELAQNYYEAEDYQKCLSAIERYEEVAMHIFDKDFDYARILSLAIVSAKKELPKDEYVAYAAKYVKVITDNCDDKDWAVLYFAAQVYVDLYSCTEEKSYLEEAYEMAFNSANELAYEQADLNKVYLNPIQKQEAEKGASARQKKEVKEYNSLIAQIRKTELPPVNEFFYLNCELLFALADQLDKSSVARQDIDGIIHKEDGKRIFLTEVLDNRFWANKHVAEINSNDIDIEFNGEKIVIPASCLTDRSVVTVSVSGRTVLDDWEVKEVKRPKNSTNCSEFMVTMTSKEGGKYKFTAGETITITIVPVSDAPDYVIEFQYKVVEKKTLGVIKGIEIERITE